MSRMRVRSSCFLVLCCSLCRGNFSSEVVCVCFVGPHQLSLGIWLPSHRVLKCLRLVQVDEVRQFVLSETLWWSSQRR